MSIEIQRVAELVSDFVDQRVENPRKDDADFWIEWVCACLFSVAFWMVAVIPAEGKTDEEYEKDLDKLLDRIADSSSRWMERRMKEGYRLGTATITIDLRPSIKARMVAYFSEAALAVDRRGYREETARSHACFVGLSNALTALAGKGLRLSRQGCEQFIQEGMRACDSMSSEIREVIQKHGKRG